MIENKQHHGKVGETAGRCVWIHRAILGGVCALVIGIYGYTVHVGSLASLSGNPADAHYNLLVQAFRAGQLSLIKEVPPWLAQLADPFDAAARAARQSEPYEMWDLSYYKGKLYLYFGVTPVLILFWPFVALTGHYLSHGQAVVIFYAIGFLTQVGLLRALWRRYFPEVSVGVIVAGALGFGLATGVTVMLLRSDVYEVAIGCGYMLTMLALGAVWCALHEKERRWRWLAAASVAYGLALGARPSLLFGALILFVPVAQVWRERRGFWVLLIAATGPMVLIGLGLMLYNSLRFDSPFEFGLRYQLTGDRQDTMQFFSLRYLWFNLRVYFLEPAHWSGRFPFVHGITAPPRPSGHGAVESAFGVLLNVPLVWLAMVVPMAWGDRSAKERSNLRGFSAAVALLFGTSAVLLCLYYWAAIRYEVEFLLPLTLLAVIGVLSLERTLACRPAWRRTARWGWGLLLGFSVAFNMLATVEFHAKRHNEFGATLEQAGRVPEAIWQCEQALRLNPDYAEAHYNLGIALQRADRMQEAIAHYEQALRLKPDYAEAHNNLGNAFRLTEKVQEAVTQYEQAMHFNPDYVEPHYNLALLLEKLGRPQEAMEHYEQALRLKPDYAEAHNNLGVALQHAGRLEEASRHYEQALRVKPDYTEAHNNLGVALQRAGRLEEAIGHYERAIRLKPDYAEAHNNLGVALQQTGRLQEAISHYEQALRLKPNFTQAQDNLAEAQALQ